jgi:hypothetical protein
MNFCTNNMNFSHLHNLSLFPARALVCVCVRVRACVRARNMEVKVP